MSWCHLDDREISISLLLLFDLYSSKPVYMKLELKMFTNLFNTTPCNCSRHDS